MAIVYRARDLRHGREVAIKVLRDDLAAAIGSERFLREIEIASSLQHPHILALHDSGEGNGLLYYVMPFAEGESLRDRLRRERQLPVEDAVRIAREVGDALSYAHSHGVIHRDIKPENILLSSGHALVADFGIARAVYATPEERLTGTGVSVGTPAYMSPEQAAGDSQFDGRSDLYALGCVLYEMLAGEPPYHGATSQAILAQQLQAPIPGLEIVRPSVPPAVVDAIETALEKVPADRFPTVSAFVDALDPDRTGAMVSRRHRRVRHRRRRMLGLAALATTVIGLLAWLLPWRAAIPLDPNKVVVFPLVERALPASEQGASYRLAVTIETALDYSYPLKWIDGWERLDERQRANLELVGAETQRAIARDRGAMYYIAGVVQGVGDSTSVSLQLLDAAGDSLIRRHSAQGANREIAVHQLGIDAVMGLLPDLIDPGRVADLTPLRNRDASAVALWIQGEREYRHLKPAEALTFYKRALERDSGLALAAVKGAQAASWQHSDTDLAALIAATVGRDTLLPPRYAHFARGLRAYVVGQADSAVFWLERALQADPDWAEARMALGEVYYHLLPSRAPLDSLAEVTFAAVLDVDSGFAPPLFHLAEMAIRKGDVRKGAQLIQRLTRAHPDTALVQQLALMFGCVEEGAGSTDWAAAVLLDPLIPLRAAESLAAAGSQPACAEAGFRALLASPVPRGYKWGAFLGLQGLLAATGRTAELTHLIDSTAQAGTQTATTLYLLDAIAGAAVVPQATVAAEFWREHLGEHYERLRLAEFRWLFGSWHAYRHEVEVVQAIHDSLVRPGADPSGSPELFGRALEAQLVLLHGDTSRAVEDLQRLSPSVVHDTLSWTLGAPLPVEHLLLAEVLLARGDYDRAYQTATVFDHQGPIIYLPFLPASLVIRLRVAEAQGRNDVARHYRERLEALGRPELVPSDR